MLIQARAEHRMVEEVTQFWEHWPEALTPVLAKHLKRTGVAGRIVANKLIRLFPVTRQP